MGNRIGCETLEAQMMEGKGILNFTMIDVQLVIKIQKEKTLTAEIQTV